MLAIVEGRADEAVLKAVLERGRELWVREIQVDFRHRSAAVCTEGPEIARIERQKFGFDKVILLWDHADSPYANYKPNKAQGIVQAELNKRSLKDCSKAIAVDPELEIWLWQDKNAVAEVLGVEVNQVVKWLEGWRRKIESTIDKSLLSSRKVDLARDELWTVVKKLPKEALEWVCRQVGEKPDARLKGEIARRADFKLWQKCESFRLLCETLREWFPERRKER